MQTNEQARANVTSKTLDEDDVVRAGNTVCMICLNSFRLKEEAACLICLHVLHVECLESWFQNVSL